ncbi:MAG: MFS transporter [Eubacteriales bacterium]|nr:MFS transporter [Eubacteriales bacterium]
MKKTIYFGELRDFLILWLTQSLSALGSAMTNFALIVWSYQARGSALTTALLSVCSYAPYVLMSIFAGSLSDRWSKKKIMLACDCFAAACTLCVLLLLRTDALQVGHLYVLNALSGLMNTLQQPASDVTTTLLTPKEHYQRVSGLRSLSNSAINILAPVLATALLAFAGIEAVIAFDLLTFAAAFTALAFFVRIPQTKGETGPKEGMLASARTGLRFLRKNRGIFDLMLFLAAINLTASMYNAAFPAMILSLADEKALGLVNTVSGLAMVAGSLLAASLPAPKSRVRVICNTLLLSMSTENFFLAFGKSTPVWCVGAVLGWLCIPLMNANLDVVMRSRIPVELQGRVFAARNTFQFFTIPVGYMLGGYLVDRVFEPVMALAQPGSLLCTLFGSGKGSGAALFFFCIAWVGVLTCLIFRRDRHIRALEKN